MQIKVTANILNVERELNEHGWIVARRSTSYGDVELWYYGFYKSEREADRVAQEIGNGVILEYIPEQFNVTRREAKISGVVNACDEVLSAPESTPTIRRCAIDTAYKRIAEIMREKE